MVTTNPYLGTKKGTLLPSLVCCLDILGYSDVVWTAIQAADDEVLRKRIQRALLRVQMKVDRSSAAAWAPDPDAGALYWIKTATDNIVIGYPIRHTGSELGEPELGHVLELFAKFQTALTCQGLLVRGGIAVGSHYMDDDQVLGDALPEAQGADASTGAPRLTVTSGILRLLREQIKLYAEERESPNHEYLLEDSDGSSFLNYLYAAVEFFREGSVSIDLVKAHAHEIETALRVYEANSDVREKFEWAARYHNFFCDDFAESHQMEDSDEVYEADPEYWTACKEVQELLQCKIAGIKLDPAPRHLTMTQ